MTKKSWQERKNKAAFYYYILMIAFVFMMFLIMLGLFNTDKIYFWWQM